MAKKQSVETTSMIGRPAVGTRISVVLPYRRPNMLCWQPETVTYTGTVVENFSWCDPDEFCMTSEDGSGFIRRIKLQRVQSMEATDGSEIARSTPSPVSRSREWTIKGSKGDVYVVTYDGSKWRCNCLAGQHGRLCKHVKSAQTEEAQPTS